MTNNESVKDHTRITTLAEKLKGKLKNFVVMDREGQLIGEVKDLILDDNRQLKIVVSRRLTTDGSSRLFLIMSKLIQKIDPSKQSVLVNMNEAEIDQLSEYVMPETPDVESSEIPSSPIIPIQSAANESTTPSYSAADVMLTSSESQNLLDQLNDNSTIEPADTPEVLEEELIRLLGERLIVDRSKHKVGEVIVRKVIETRMVQVPVRREKLIIEQVSPEHKQLAQIDLGEEELADIDLTEAASIDNEIPSTQTASLDGLTVRGVFNSPKIASLFLNAIALERRHGCKEVRLEIVVEDAERQKTYQEWIERSSGSQLGSQGNES